MLINSLSMLLPFSAADKQALLEAPSLITRRETLAALMEYALAKGDDETMQ
jgi:Lon protease-like protein